MGTLVIRFSSVGDIVLAGTVTRALALDGARHQEACAALRSQLETRANDHRQALEAQQAH